MIWDSRMAFNEAVREARDEAEREARDEAERAKDAEAREHVEGEKAEPRPENVYGSGSTLLSDIFGVDLGF